MAIRCAHCSRWLAPEEAGRPCPRCGSMDRKAFAQDQAIADEKAEVAKELANKHYQAEAGLRRWSTITWRIGAAWIDWPHDSCNHTCCASGEV
jgi:phage FluMu protein Com